MAARLFSRTLSALATLWAYLTRGVAETRFRSLYVEELPESLQERTLYIVSEKGTDTYAALACPKGCEINLNMNLLPDDCPRWRLDHYEDGVPSLHPSVRRIECGCHFWLRRGKLIWC